MPHAGRSALAPRLVTRLALGLMVLVGAAGAQPLVALAPTDTVLALRYATGGSIYPELAQDLEALDTEALASAVRATLEGLRDQVDESDADAIGMILELLDGGHRPLAGLAEGCPALATAEVAFEPVEALFSLSMSPFAPVPIGLLAVRVADEDADDAGALLDELVGCFGAGMTLDQDGVPLYVLGDGSDLPVTVARSGGLFLAASQIDAVRGALRRAGGSPEGSLAATELGSSPALGGTGLGAALQLAALADVADAMGGLAGPDAAPAIRRLTSALRTLPYVAARVEARPEGLVSEAWLRVDPTGGDAALARLVRCADCRVRPSVLTPASALGVRAMPLRLRDWTDYLIDLAEEIASSFGETVDLRQELHDETGIDLDADLFAWLGDRIDLITLPPVRSNLAGLAGQTANVVLIPVASAEAAKAGIDRLAEAARPWFGEVERSMARDLEVSIDDLIAVRTTAYGGVEITRVQTGPTTDVGVAYLGNHLVVASPAAAVRAVIDTFQGGPTIFDNPAFREILRQSPDDVTSFHMADDAAVLRLYQPLLASLAQPLAFSLQTALAGGGMVSVPLATLLQAADLPAEVVGVLADHLRVSRGWTLPTEDGVYRYGLVPLR